jgi:hypothetical protein
MPINLTGMNNSNEMNLTGKNEYVNPISNKLKILKKYILTNYILPLYSEQWDILNRNKFLMDETIRQIEKYVTMYKTEDLLAFLELMKILKIVIDKNEFIIALESKHQKYDKNNIVNMVYKTTKIRLMPEYEIYHHIIGKPNRKLDEDYNEEIMHDIRRLMVQERITFDKIHETILQKYTQIPRF